MVLNPLGFQQVFDWGAPKIISGRAREAISGGQLVFSSGAAAVVTSGVSSFATSDLLFATGANGVNFNGVALNTVGSNGLVSVATGNIAIISTAAGTIVSGRLIQANTGDAVLALVSGSEAGNVVGRALTSAGSEGYCLWSLMG